MLTATSLNICPSFGSRVVKRHALALTHLLKSLDLLQEVADKDVDGGVLLCLPVSQNVLEMDWLNKMRSVKMSVLLIIVLILIQIWFANIASYV